MMKRFKICIYFLSILFVGCTTSKLNNSTSTKVLPETFSGKKDSTNSALINRNYFFEDSLLIVLIDSALINNHDVLMTMQKVEISRAELRMSKGAMLPFINGVGGYSQRKFGRYTMDGAGNLTTEIAPPGQLVPVDLPNYSMGLQSSWEVDVWGKLKNRKRSSFARYLKSTEGKNLVITNLVSEIANTYYELLSLDIELEIIRQTISIQQDALLMIIAQKQAGGANELAVKQFEAQVLNSKSMEYEVLQKIAENENKINFLSGRFPQVIKREKFSFNNLLPNKIKTGIPSDLLQNRPDIKQAEYELLASNSDVKSAKAAFYPSFVITGSIGFEAFNSSMLFSSPQSVAYSLFGNAAAPLINRSAISAQFKSAKAKQLDALFNYQKTILKSYMEVANELSNIHNLEQIHELKNKEVEALTNSITVSGDLFKAGKATYLEVLMTQRSSLQSQLELVNVKKRQHNAVINIYKALGGGWK